MLHNQSLTTYYISQLATIKKRYDYLCQKVFDIMEFTHTYGARKHSQKVFEMKEFQKEMVQLDAGRQLIYEKVFRKD